MTIHPSLSSKGKNKRSRSVLKRFERVRELEEKEKRNFGDSVFGLPKLKTISLKLRKAKKATEEEKAAALQDGAGTTAAKPAAPVKKEASPKKK